MASSPAALSAKPRPRRSSVGSMGSLPPAPKTSSSLFAVDVYALSFASFSALGATELSDPWFITLLCAVLYTVMELPLDVAFNMPPIPWMIFDGIVVIIFAIDIVVNFYSPYKNIEDEWVTDLAKIKRHYLRTWFMYDLISTIPVDFIVFLVTNQSSHPVQALRLLKTIRLFRAMKLLDNIDIKGLPAWMQLWCLIYMFVLTAHWFACIFWKIAVIEGFENSWVGALAPQLPAETIISQYTHCLYWAVATVTTLGYGDVHPVTFPEYLFVTVAIFTGATFYAVIIAAVGGHVVSSRFAAKTEYNRYLDAMLAFERFNNLPPSVRERIDVYCEHIWKRRKSFLEERIHEKLPVELRNAINEAIHAKVVKRSRVLSACDSKGFLKRFAELIQPVGMCVPDEVLYVQGQPIERLFFCHRGRIGLSMRLENEANDVIFASVADGQYCGDQGLFELPPVHECSGVAVAFCDTYFVSASGLLDLLALFPRERAIFERIAKERGLAAKELIREYQAGAPQDSPSVVAGGWLHRLKHMGRAPVSRGSWVDKWTMAVSPASTDAITARVLASSDLPDRGQVALPNQSLAHGEVPEEEELPDWAWGDTDVDKGLLLPRTIDGVYRSIADRLGGAAAVEEEKPAKPDRPWLRPPPVAPGDHVRWEQDSLETRMIRLEANVSKLGDALARIESKLNANMNF